jgi:hypothetical protein
MPHETSGTRTWRGSNTTTAPATRAAALSRCSISCCSEMLQRVSGISGCCGCFSAISPALAKGAANGQGRQINGGPVASRQRCRTPTPATGLRSVHDEFWATAPISRARGRAFWYSTVRLSRHAGVGNATRAAARSR